MIESKSSLSSLAFCCFSQELRPAAPERRLTHQTVRPQAPSAAERLGALCPASPFSHLLSDRSWKAAPDLGKAFHDWLGEGKDGFALEKAS
jgi:hypothetical protein